MSLLTRLLPPAPERAARAKVRALEARLAVLHADGSRLARAAESLELADRLLDPLDRYRDGDRVWLPLGTPNDRKGGGDRPALATETDLRQQRGFARLLCQTNYLAGGALDRVADFVLGDGAAWQVTLRGAKPGPVWSVAGREPPAAVKNAQAVLDGWRELAQWGAGPGPLDPDGPTGVLHDRRREAFKRSRRDGEVFLRFFANGRDLPLVRFVEPDLVGTPPGHDPSGPAGWGVETADAGAGPDAEGVAGYWLLDPDGLSDVDFVAAGRLVHGKTNVDAAVKRGLSDFFSLTEDFETVRKLLRNATETAAILASIAYIRQHAPGATPDGVRRMIGQGADALQPRPGVGGFAAGGGATRPLRQMDPGTVLDVSAGMEHVAPPVFSNLPAVQALVQGRLRALSRKWGMPEDLISGDASNGNYASILVAGGPFERAARSLQREWGMVERAVAYRVLAFAVRCGRLMADEAAAVEVHVVAPAVAVSDRAGEAQRAVALIAAKVLSPQTAAAELGYDPSVEAANIAAWEEAHPDPAAGVTPGLFGGPAAEGRGGRRRARWAEKTVVGTDRNGHKYKTVDGKRVPLGGPPAAAGAAAAGRSVFGTARSLASKALDTKVGRVLGAAEHTLSIAAHKTRDVAERAAVGRGYTPDQAARLKRTLAMADFAGGYVTGYAGYQVAGPLGGKAAMFAPSASAVYLAYSAARDPRATWAAAKAVVADSTADPRAAWRGLRDAWSGKAHEAAAALPAWLDALAAAMAGDDADWRQAVFLRALQAGRPAADAAAMAVSAPAGPA